MRSIRIVGVLVVLCLGLAVPAGAAGSSPGGSTGGDLPGAASQSTLLQDPAWVALKESGRIAIGANGAPMALAASAAIATVPASALLSYSVTAKHRRARG